MSCSFLCATRHDCSRGLGWGGRGGGGGGGEGGGVGREEVWEHAFCKPLVRRTTEAK